MGTSPVAGITSLSQVHVRQERAPQHQRPLLGQTYAPSPAPGETINVLRKKILKRGEPTVQELKASLLGTSRSSSPPPRIGTSGSNSVKFLDSEMRPGNSLPSLPPWLGAEALERNRLLDCPEPVTPRGQWRKQVRVKHKALSPAAVALGDAAHTSDCPNGFVSAVLVKNHTLGNRSARFRRHTPVSPHDLFAL